ncbi:MAG: hypothetical protein ACE5Q6_05085 [Dehalococcoidia bacterium]
MAKAAKYRVLIVGCGQLGSRHLQAVASLPLVREVELVDPRPEGLELGRERLAQISNLQPSITFRWLSSLEEATPSGDLCIVATQADIRCQVVHQVVDQLKYSNFLLEKLVAQSTSEYLGLLQFSQENSLRVWVNCKARAHFSHQRAKSKLDPAEPITFSHIGGNHGLANNGIHAADLFVFYDGTDHIEAAGANIDPILHSTKRGSDIYDLSGTLYGSSEKGSPFILSFAASHTGPAHFSITSPRYRAFIDDMSKLFYESTLENDWAWRQVPFDANLMVSHMTRSFAADILQLGTCELPTLEECFPAHQYILNSLRPCFNQLLSTKDERCPVT